MNALRFLQEVSGLIGLLFLICYFYQLLYIPVALLGRKKERAAVPPRRYAVLISARNEEAVIGRLLDSIHQQDYPAGYVVPFVVADNCSDGTARAARDAGAVVYERTDRTHVGKGYALDFLLGQIRDAWGDEYFDGYFVFDADNLLRPDYISRMNEVFSPQRQIVTSYRNSKNFGDNWISAGYGLWFIRDSFFLNHPRARLGISAVVAGTGFLFSREIMLKNGGWPFHSLSEDTEFTVRSVLQGEKVSFCREAELFDEQPTRFSQSWNQRLRWVRGNIQVFSRHGWALLKGLGGKNALSCLDLLLSIPPAILLTVCSTAVGIVVTVLELLAGNSPLPLLAAGLSSFLVPYGLLLLAGAVTTVTQWSHIHAAPWKRVLYTFTFPLFILTYIPITIAALFGRVEWKPIEHKAAITLQDLR